MADFFDTTGVRSMELFCNCYLDGVGLSLGLPPFVTCTTASKASY